MKIFTICLVAILCLSACSPSNEPISSYGAADEADVSKLALTWPTEIGRHDFEIRVPAGHSDPETFIPITVINGQRSGPTLLMVAGVHGYEFAPILAAKELADELKASKMSGRVVIVRTAHVSAFEARSPYVNPYDRLNLNRSFPGRANGTQTERIAYALSTHVIPQADIVLDVHSGDGAEWLEAFIGVYGGPLATNYSQALSVAEHFGFSNIVRYKMNTQEQVDTRRSLNRQAVAEGLPTLLVEIGENGKRDAGHVQAIVSGVKNALNVVGILPEHNATRSPNIRYLDGTNSVPVEHSGIWTPKLARAQIVQTGDILGFIHDYDGTLLQTVEAPVEGYTIYGLAGPPVRKGESVATIGRVVDTFK